MTMGSYRDQGSVSGHSSRTSEKSGVPPKAYLGLCIKDNWKMSLPVEIFVLDLNLLSEVSEFLLFGELSSQLF